MAKKATNFSNLIQRVTASCLLHPIGNHQFKAKLKNPDEFDDYNDHNINNGGNNSTPSFSETNEEEEEEEEESGEFYEDAREELSLQSQRYNNGGVLWDPQVMSQVFDSITALKKAYGKLQEAHNPWDTEKMRAADAAVVTELRRLAVLRERWRRGGDGRRDGSGVAARAAETVREVVAPYEAAVEELKKVVKVKEVEVEELKKKVNFLSGNESNIHSGKKNNGKELSRKKGGNYIQHQGKKK